MIGEWIASLFVPVGLTRVSTVWTSPRIPPSPCCTRRCWRQWRRPALSVWSECWPLHFELIKYISSTRLEEQRKRQTPEALRRTFYTPYHLKMLLQKQTEQKTLNHTPDRSFSDSNVIFFHGQNWSALDAWRRPAECKAESLKRGTKRTQRTLIFSLFLSVKKTFFTELREWTNIELFQTLISDRLKRDTWQRCPVCWIETCPLFFLSYLYTSPCHMFVLSSRHVRLWHFRMNSVVHVLSHAAFSKGMLHSDAL